MGREMGGRFKKKGTSVYLWLIHADVWQKPTKFCKATILQLKEKVMFGLTTQGLVNFQHGLLFRAAILSSFFHIIKQTSQVFAKNILSFCVMLINCLLMIQFTMETKYVFGSFFNCFKPLYRFLKIIVDKMDMTKAISENIWFLCLF